jgi:Family of unknown function (DUF5681)
MARQKRRAVVDASYPVGYCRTPVHSRFKPGQSGNPKGRPKSRRDLQTELLGQVVEKRVTIREGETLHRLSLPAANVFVHGMKGAKGDVRSAGLFFKILCELFDQEEDRVSDSYAMAQAMRPCAPLFENVVADRLSRDEKIELAILAKIIDEGGDVTALRTDQFDRLKYLLEKGRGNG